MSSERPVLGSNFLREFQRSPRMLTSERHKVLRSSSRTPRPFSPPLGSVGTREESVHKKFCSVCGYHGRKHTPHPPPPPPQARVDIIQQTVSFEQVSKVVRDVLELDM